METEVKLTKLAKCAGCGAKVGAGTLSRLLKDLKTHTDPNLIVGFDKSDDASVYVINEDTAIIQTVDFFPPIADDPFLYGQIAAANAISDVYAMGGEPKLALNLLCTMASMKEEWIQEILRGGYSKAYEAGVIISGGHTIEGSEPLYGLAVTGFGHPRKILRNDGAKPGDALILTKPLGTGILTTANKAGMVDEEVMKRLYVQLTTLNKAAAEVMRNSEVHGCTDVTGFGLLGHSYEMAQGSDTTLHLFPDRIPWHPEAYELAEMGFIPAGAYRNRSFAEAGVYAPNVTRAVMDILFDPQTSGGLLISVSEQDADELLRELRDAIPSAAMIGHVREKEEHAIILDE